MASAATRLMSCEGSPVADGSASLAKFKRGGQWARVAANRNTDAYASGNEADIAAVTTPLQCRGNRRHHPRRQQACDGEKEPMRRGRREIFVPTASNSQTF
jgi:hypothetical protein